MNFLPPAKGAYFQKQFLAKKQDFQIESLALYKQIIYLI